jgi:hypothetical protein
MKIPQPFVAAVDWILLAISILRGIAAIAGSSTNYYNNNNPGYYGGNSGWNCPQGNCNYQEVCSLPSESCVCIRPSHRHVNVFLIRMEHFKLVLAFFLELLIYNLFAD